MVKSVFSQFLTIFFAKIEKIAHTCNGKDMLNIQIGITTDYADIFTVFACMVRFSGSENSNTLSEFSKEHRKLLWQPYCTNFSYV